MNCVRTMWQRRYLRIAAAVLVVVTLVLVVGLYYVPMRPADSVAVTVQYSHYQTIRREDPWHQRWG